MKKVLAEVEKTAKQAGPNAYVNIAVVDNKPVITGITQKPPEIKKPAPALGPAIKAYDPAKSVSLEELVTGKSDRYSAAELKKMVGKLSAEDQKAISKMQSEQWWKEGSVSSTIFDNVVQPYANAMNSFLTKTPVGQFINRTSETSAGVTGTKTSTGNPTADKTATVAGTVMGFFAPIGGSGIVNASANGAAALTKVGKETENVIQGTGQVIKGFTGTESKIINEAKEVINSPAFVQIKAANEAGKSVTVNIGGKVIQYEPGLPASGMTMFGDNGFLIGNEAFSSEAELAKTVLHELYRLTTSASAEGVSAGLATKETQAAFNFAEKALKELSK
ncbi:hypothetical protein [Cohnella sp.]|uniref:hypothetical protein n=1 Tax=Cohnella sp. TaxID=1883426 RepID=UPI003561621B